MIPNSLEVLLALWRASWQAAALALVVMLVCRIGRKSISPSAQTLLWSLPILRLLLLAIPASSISIYNVTTWLGSTPQSAVAFEADSLPKTNSTSVDRLDAKHSSPVAHQTTLAADQMTLTEHTTDAQVSPKSSRAVAISSAAASSASPVTIADAIVSLWILGAFAFALRILVAHFAVRKIIASAQPLSFESILGKQQQTSTPRGIVRCVRFVLVDQAYGPAVTGVLFPTVLLPKKFLNEYSKEELEMTVTHELEHVRRCDTLLVFIAQIAIVVHWWNPLAYWLKKRIQEQAEIAVDAATLCKIGPEKVKPYAELLFKIARSNAAPAHLVAMARASSRFRHRIEQLAAIEPTTPLRSASSVLVVLLLVVCGLSDARSQEVTKKLASPAIAEPEKQPEKPLPALPQTAQYAPEDQERAEAVEPKAEASAPSITTESVKVAQAEESPVTETMQTVTGKVVDVRGKAVPNAILHCDSWDTQKSKRAKMRGETDHLGGFKLTFPQATSEYDPLYTWVHAEGYGLRVVAMQRVLKEKKNVSDITITLPDLAKKPTNIQIADPNGQPLAGALVCAKDVELPNGSFQADEREGMTSPIPDELWGRLAVRTDGQGRATLSIFPDGMWYGVACKTEEYGHQEFDGVKFTTDTRLKLSPVGSIHGKIHSEDRAIFKDFGVQVQTTEPSTGTSSVHGLARAKFDENGEFHIPTIAAGQIGILYVGSPVPSDRELVTTKPYSQSRVLPNATLELAFEAPPTIRVSGVVLTSDTRQPVKGATINYSSFRGPHERYCFTDENGEFQLNVAPGKVDFQMISLGDIRRYLPRSYDYPRNFPDEITKETRLEILLPVSKSIKGRLLDATGRPIANQMLARHTGQHRHLCGFATTDDAGNFEMAIRRNWPLTDGYWVMIDQIEPNQRKEIVIQQKSNNGDFFELQLPAEPIAAPKTR